MQFARPTNKKPAEYLILEERKKFEERRGIEELTRKNLLSDLKTEWQRNTDNKIEANIVKRRVESLLLSHEVSIEDRRVK